MTHNERMRKNLMVVGFLWLLAIGGVVGGRMYLQSKEVAEDPTSRLKPFDGEVWRSASDTDPSSLWPHKLCMVDDLIASHKLDGLSSNEVIRLLGEPMEGAQQLFGKGYHYYLGPRRGETRLDSENLQVTFDETGTVKKYWIDIR